MDLRTVITFAFAAGVILPRHAEAQITDPAVVFWRINATGLTGQSMNPMIHMRVSMIDADVQQVRYNATDVFVNATGIPSHPIGPWGMNPAVPVDINGLYRIPRTPPSAAMVPPPTQLAPIGIFTNGVPVFNYSDANSYNNMGVWNNNAVVARAEDFDQALGHPSPLMMMMGMTPVAEEELAAHGANAAYLHTHAGGGSAWHYHADDGEVIDMPPGVLDLTELPPPPNGLYHYHQQSPALRMQIMDDGSHHSPVTGFMFDGLPIYGPFGFDNTDGSGGVVRIRSSYRLRSITVRQTLPDGTPLAPAQYGPPVNTTYPLGYFIEDFEYVPGLGHLDEKNGRFAVTPEYPLGVYAYHTTTELDGSMTEQSAFPYILGSHFYGNLLADNVSQTVSVPGGVIPYVPPTPAPTTTPSPTGQPTPTPSVTSTATPSPLASSTPSAPPTATPSPDPSATVTVTATPTTTATPSPDPSATASPPPCCPGDADNSGGAVNANDFLSVQGNFGLNNGPGGPGDADCSGGAVNATDFLQVQAAFGSDCGSGV